MPVPFNRFRILNNSNRDVTTARFRRFSNTAGNPPEARFVDTNDLDHVEDVTAAAVGGPVLQGTARDYSPTKVAYFTDGVKVLGLNIVVGTGGSARTLDTWELFYPEDDFDPEGNYVTEADVYVENEPSSNTEYYVRAHVWFADGTEWDYYSPILHA
jgi:hypothetical protein